MKKYIFSLKVILLFGIFFLSGMIKLYAQHEEKNGDSAIVMNGSFFHVRTREIFEEILAGYPYGVPKEFIEKADLFQIGEKVLTLEEMRALGQKPGREMNSLEVICKEKKSETVYWKSKLPSELYSVRPPYYQFHGNSVFVSHRKGVCALATGNGALLWSVEGPNDRLFVNHNLLFAVGYYSSDPTYWLVARKIDTGEEAFKLKLGTHSESSNLDAEPMEALGTMVLLQNKGNFNHENAFTYVIASDGSILFQSAEFVEKIKMFANSLLLLRCEKISRIKFDGTSIWKVAFQAENTNDDDLEGFLIDKKQLIVFAYDQISDSGVTVLSLNFETGEKQWLTKCEGIAVGHSKYNHFVYLLHQKEKLYVISHGSYGSFVQILDLKTGKALNRF